MRSQILYCENLIRYQPSVNQPQAAVDHVAGCRLVVSWFLEVKLAPGNDVYLWVLIGDIFEKMTTSNV